jgi:hypothetical protein
VPVAPGVSSAPQVPLPRAEAAGPSRSSLALRALVVLAVSAAVAAVVGTLTSGSTPSAPQRSTAAPRSEIDAVQRAQAASFAILRRPRGPRDRVATLDAGAGPLGANPTLARSVPMPAGALAPRLLSVVPANGGVCLRLLFKSGVVYWECRTTRQATGGELIAGLRPIGAPGQRPLAPPRTSSQFIVGLVPDGVRTVTVRAAHGVTRTLLVAANVYATTIFAPRTISFALPGQGATSYPAP